eukprot:XP_001697299.1 predicted protein [Chlamydomonas reinhardtii]
MLCHCHCHYHCRCGAATTSHVHRDPASDELLLRFDARHHPPCPSQPHACPLVKPVRKTESNPAPVGAASQPATSYSPHILLLLVLL